MAKTYIKDKKDFMEAYYGRLKDSLQQIVAYREVGEKVEVKIMIPSYCEIARNALNKIKD